MPQEVLISSSSIIHDLTHLPQTDGVTYFYCDGASNLVPKRETRYILGSILRQLFEILLKKAPDLIARDLERVYEALRDNAGSKVIELLVQGILALAANSFASGNVYIVVDGIDECPKKDDLSDSLRRLATSNIKVLAISRFVRDIAKAFSEHPHLEISEEISAKDIETHLKWSFNNDPKLKLISAKLRTEIKSQLLSKSEGMYVTALSDN